MAKRGIRIIPVALFVCVVGCEAESLDDAEFRVLPGDDDGVEDDTTDTGEPEEGALRVVLVGDGGPFIDNPLNGFAGGSFDGLIVSIYIDDAGSHYEWRRYHGGNKNEALRDLDIDATGRICASGWTNSSDLPTTTGAIQGSFGLGTRDLFYGCWSATGSLHYASYLGGKLAELNDTSISLTSDGSLIVTGSTNSLNLATTGGAVQPAPAGANDALAFKLGSSGSPITWGSYLGGTGNDSLGPQSDVGPDGSVWLVGTTASANFPVTDASTLAGGQDGFVARISADGSTLLAASYIGGSADDFGHAISVLPDGTAVTCGQTYSDDFPTTAGVVQTAHAAQASPNYDLVLTHLDTDASVLAATYLGGVGFDACRYLDVDAAGDVYVTGWTDNLPDFPLTTVASVFGAYNPDSQLGYLVKIDADLENVEYAVRTNIARGMDVLDDGRVVYLAAANPGLTETPNAIPGESGNALVVYEQDGVTVEYLGYVMGEGMTVYALQGVEL